MNKDDIRMFLTVYGTVIGEAVESGSDALIKLKYPFRIIANEDSTVSVAALFMKEEWCILSPLSSVETSVIEGLKDMYIKYVQEVHSTIIMPNKPSLIL
jgi:hypothetical protein